MRSEVKVRKGGRGQLRSARREGEGGEGEARVVSFHERTSAHSRVELIQVDAEYPSLQDRRRLKSSKLARSEREKEKRERTRRKAQLTHHLSLASTHPS